MVTAALVKHVCVTFSKMCHILGLSQQQIILLCTNCRNISPSPTLLVLNTGNWAVQFIHQVSLWLQGYTLPGANLCFPLAILLHHVLLSERREGLDWRQCCSLKGSGLCIRTTDYSFNGKCEWKCTGLNSDLKTISVGEECTLEQPFIVSCTPTADEFKYPFINTTRHVPNVFFLNGFKTWM